MMPKDCFALLGEPRRPWLDAEALKTRFMELSAEAHPDRAHAASPEVRREAEVRFADLNAAHQVLREPRQRVLHLIELEGGQRPRDIQRIPPGTMDLFVEVGEACREVDRFLEKRSSVGSPMLKVQLFAEGMAWVARLQTLQGRFKGVRESLEAELRGMNPVWDSAPPQDSAQRASQLPLGRLEEVYRALSYLARWGEQVQERLVQLASV